MLVGLGLRLAWTVPMTLSAPLSRSPRVRQKQARERETSADPHEAFLPAEVLEHLAGVVQFEQCCRNPQLTHRVRDELSSLRIAEGARQHLGEVQGRNAHVQPEGVGPTFVTYSGIAKTTVVVLWNPDMSPAERAISP